MKGIIIYSGVQTLVFVVTVAYGIWREMRQAEVIADLLDRLMARDFMDYSAPKIAVGRPLRRRVVTDEEMAELEKQARGARKAVKA